MLEGGKARVVELVVPGNHQETSLKMLGLPRDSIVGTILRGHEAIVPRGEDLVRGGDRLQDMFAVVR